MVRTVQEPILTTPQILRCSTSISQHQASQNSTSSLKDRSRVILGERSDNVMPSPSRVRSSKKHPGTTKLITTTGKSAASPKRLSLSRFIATSPQRVRIPSSTSPNAYFFSADPGHTSFRMPRSSMLMPTDNETFLLDMSMPGEMAFGGFETTDESEDGHIKTNTPQRYGGLMTPEPSQEILHHESPSCHQTVKKKLARQIIPARLPTPPATQSSQSSQTLGIETVRASRVRTRPAPTPPRRTLPYSPTTISGCSATDQDGQPKVDPSPNPRRKKKLRLSESHSKRVMEVVIPMRRLSGSLSRETTPRASSQVTVSQPTTSGNSKGKGRMRALCESSTSDTLSAACKNRLSHELTSVRASKTPAPSRNKVAPMTAPIRRYQSNKICSTATKSTYKRRASTGNALTSSQHRKGGGKGRSTLSPEALDGLNTILDQPIESSPGDDPLLLKGFENQVEAWDGRVTTDRYHGTPFSELPSESGLGLNVELQDFPPSVTEVCPTARTISPSVQSSPSSPTLNDDAIDNRRMGELGTNDWDFTFGPNGSDDGSVADDTFLHIERRLASANSGVKEMDKMFELRPFNCNEIIPPASSAVMEILEKEDEVATQWKKDGSSVLFREESEKSLGGAEANAEALRSPSPTSSMSRCIPLPVIERPPIITNEQPLISHHISEAAIRSSEKDTEPIEDIELAESQNMELETGNVTLEPEAGAWDEDAHSIGLNVDEDCLLKEDNAFPSATRHAPVRESVQAAHLRSPEMNVSDTVKELEPDGWNGGDSSADEDCEFPTSRKVLSSRLHQYPPTPLAPLPPTSVEMPTFQKLLTESPVISIRHEDPHLQLTAPLNSPTRLLTKTSRMDTSLKAMTTPIDSLKQSSAITVSMALPFNSAIMMWSPTRSLVLTPPEQPDFLFSTIPYPLHYAVEKTSAKNQTKQLKKSLASELPSNTPSPSQSPLHSSLSDLDERHMSGRREENVQIEESDSYLLPIDHSSLQPSTPLMLKPLDENPVQTSLPLIQSHSTQALVASSLFTASPRVNRDNTELTLNIREENLIGMQGSQSKPMLAPQRDTLYNYSRSQHIQTEKQPSQNSKTVETGEKELSCNESTEENIGNRSGATDETIEAEDGAWDISVTTNDPLEAKDRGEAVHDVQNGEQIEEPFSRIDEGTCDNPISKMCETQEQGELENSPEREEYVESDDENEERSEIMEKDSQKRVTLRIIDTGVVKIEPGLKETEQWRQRPHVQEQRQSFCPLLGSTPVPSSTIQSIQPPLDHSSQLPADSISTLTASHMHSQVGLNTPVRSSSTPQPLEDVAPITPHLYPPLDHFTSPLTLTTSFVTSTPANEGASNIASTPVQPPIFRFSNENSAQGISSLGRMFSKRGINHTNLSNHTKMAASHSLSHFDEKDDSAEEIKETQQSTDESLETDNSHNTSTNSDDETANKSVRVIKPRKSLHDELVAAADQSEENDGLRSVVEVSSLDPKAAARAAAILKLNHSYIEHGILPRHDLDATSSRNKHSVDRHELLHEAELEIVAHGRGRSYSLSRATSLEQELNMQREEREFSFTSFRTEDYPIPGGYIKTPAKRARSPQAHRSHGRSHSSIAHVDLAHTSKNQDKKSKAWGVPEWKRLEKIYREEREIWTKERKTKPLPGGVISWARRATFIASNVVVKKWDIEQVADRFLREEGERSQNSEWARDLVLLRIQAMEKKTSRLKADGISSEEIGTPAPKKQRTTDPNGTSATPLPAISQLHQAVETPSAMNRVFDFVWGKGKKVRRKEEAEEIDKGLARDFGAVDKRSKDEEKAKELQMIEVANDKSVALSHTPVAAGISFSDTTATSLASFTKNSFLKSTVPASSSDFNPSSSYSYRSNPGRLYPPLNPPLTQRSSAIAKLFPEETRSVPPPLIKESIKTSGNGGLVKKTGSVKDLAKAFEERSFEK
ncbi:uncharacterized protein L203_104520 [Cryptococcus depauperatus CBS 7841]|uniref:Uncharacterized protein n=1 Tax=Cryptococcus depauperatus CBS 7841 TaxID=1295531 RepID=A0A1E3ILU5_9TREE|nr:hypothetical protein L203_02286 [Cryptococcus depauperatus CBS 7841]